MIQPVVQDPDPILHKKTEEIRNFRDPSLKKMVRDMKETLLHEDGLGLASPQIGISLSLFVIPPEYAPQVRTLSAPLSLFRPLHPTVFINPRLMKHGKDKEAIEEGCLSVKNTYHPITRSYEVTLEARNEKGQKFRVTASGLLARIFQHETDHLNGILFLDRLHEK